MNITVSSSKLIKSVISLMMFGVVAFSASASSESALQPHIVSSMPANSWLEIPNSQLDSVAADPEVFLELQAYGGIYGITAWSGAVFDTRRNRLVVWGGGHGDYAGNEIYAFDTDTLTWDRLTDPSDPNLNLGGQVNGDGTPNSRHTYNGLAYIEHADRLFGTGGSLAGPGGCGADKTWIFDFNSEQWTDMNPATRPHTDCENVSTYDPETQKVWFFDGPAGLWSYTFNTNTWVRHNGDLILARTAVVDTKRGLLVVVGQGEVVAYNIRGGDYTQMVWDTNGGESLINKGSPGLAYDSVTDRIVGWHGGSVYSLNPETKVWTEHSAPGGPNTNFLDDVYGMWRYVPNLNAFVVMTGAQNNVYFYKLSAGPG